MMPSAPAHTMSDLLQAYSAEYLPKKSANHQYQQRLLYLRFHREMGAMLLTDLTPLVLRRWRDHLLKSYAPSTVCRYMDALSAPLTIAVRDYRWLPENPFRRVEKPAEPPGRIRFLSHEERNALLVQCQLSLNPHLYLLVLLALTTGGRKNELRELQWQHVDLQQGTVRFLRTKNKQPRTVPVRGQALQLLQQRGQGQPGAAWVFARRDGRQPILIEQAWNTARRRAGLPDFRFHDLRHTAGSYLAMSGSSALEIAAILGHKSAVMAGRYIHFSDTHTASVVARMTEQFLNV